MIDARFTAKRCVYGILVMLLVPALWVGADHDKYVTLSQCKESRDPEAVVKNGPNHDAMVLDLTNCSLKSVESGLLSGFSQQNHPKLRDIYLRHNDMEYINLEVFKPVAHVKFLYMSNNKLRQIPVFDEHAPLSNLIVLELSFNQITQLNNPMTFANCRQLESLSLDYNQIAYIRPDIFKPLENLDSINLSYNRIISIPDGMFQLPSIIAIELNNNLIEYVAPHAIGSNIGMISLKNNKISFLPAHFAFDKTKLQDPWGAIYVTDNPWHCACLLEHIADLKKAGVNQVFRMYGTSPVCVFLGRQACHRHVPSALLPSL